MHILYIHIPSALIGSRVRQQPSHVPSAQRSLNWPSQPVELVVTMATPAAQVEVADEWFPRGTSPLPTWGMTLRCDPALYLRVYTTRMHCNYTIFMCMNNWLCIYTFTLWGYNIIYNNYYVRFYYDEYWYALCIKVYISSSLSTHTLRTGCVYTYL